MATAWAHLPNTRHIDGILADAKARPEVWHAAGYTVWGGGLSASWTTARDAARDAERDAARDAAWETAWGAIEDAENVALTIGHYVLLALLAWPDSARMLYMTPAALRTLIDITEGDVRHQAVLILPAVLAGYKVTTGD